MRNPPKLVTGILKRILRQELFNGIYGDLLEDYHQQEHLAKWKADLKFLINGLGFFRFPGLLKTQPYQTNPIMNTWKNYFKISIRNLTRNKANTAISVIGLVVSFTSCLAILQYVRFEKSYDDFHQPNVYRLTHEMTSSSTVSLTANTFYGAMGDLREQIPSIENATHISTGGRSLIRVGERAINQENIAFATPSLFEMFGFEVSDGRVFDSGDPNSVVVSRSTAERFFPNSNALNQTIELDGFFGSNWSPKIVAIYEDLPGNTHLLMDVILPMEKLVSLSEEGQFFGPNFTFEQVRWLWLGFPTYIQLREGTNPIEFEEMANEIVAANRRERNELLNQHHKVWLQPVQEIHTTAGIENEMRPVNDVNIINLFAIVAICILMIGWINYINLSTARSINRGKEVGIRKVLGSSVLQLKTQFQVEAFVINLLAFLLSIGLLLLIAPLLEGITDVTFFDTLYNSTPLLGMVLCAVLLGSIISGYYPSQVLSNFRSIDILKGKLKHSSKGVLLRRVLVGIQFVFTLFLMSGLMIVHRQMTYMLDHDLGMDISQTLIINSSPDAAVTPEYTGKMTSLKNELETIAGVQINSVGTMAPGLNNGWRVSTEDNESERSGVFIQRSLVDHTYFDLYDIEVVVGRQFDKRFGSEARNVILNITATQRLGFESPEAALGYDLAFTGEQFKVVGVVDDFYQQGVQTAILPMLFNLDTALIGQFIALKVEQGSLSDVMPEVERIYKDIFPRAPFESRVVEDVYAAQYNSERRFRTLFSIFTSIATIIAILGLLGLASFILNQRLKEVCVRKVLGAHTSGLFMILNKEYLIINLVSFLVAIPIAVYLMQDWLAGFENRIQLGMAYFAIPLATTFVIVLISTVHQTLRVINSNPSTILKEDD